MKKILVFSLLLNAFLHSGSYAQTQSFHPDKPIDLQKIFAAPQPSLVMGFTNVSEARTIIGDIMQAVNQQQNFKVQSTSQIDNAAAVIYQGQRYILYNPSFINQLDDAANDRWASISVLAHEIGHHLLGHTLDGRGSQLPKELAADEFSGYALRRMGASLQQAQLAMQLIASPRASATHPAERDRLVAIQNGWNKTSAANDVASNYPAQKPVTTSPSPTNYPRQTYPDQRTARTDYPSIDRRYPSPRNQPSRTVTNYPTYPNRRNTQQVQTIAYDVKFNNINGIQYFITSQNNVVKYNGSRYVVVAKLAPINNANYPYVMYDDQVQLLVDRRGNLRTDSGRPVGFIREH